MKLAKSVFLFILGVCSLTSCARQISSDVYSGRQVGEASFTYTGSIRNIREVCVDSSDGLENNEVGVIGGGVAGGVLGNAISRGHFLPTAAGAIAGAVAGSLVESKIKQQMAFEYIVELDAGRLMTVVQGKDDCFCIGQPVYVIVSQSGRSRITPQ